MDINDTRFHLLLGESDWASCTTLDGFPVTALPTGSDPARPSFAWDTQTQELTLQPEVFLFTQQSAPQRVVSVDVDRRGADADQFGNVYWIDAGGTSIQVMSAGSGQIGLFWSSTARYMCTRTETGGFNNAQQPESLSPLSLAGLAITVDHFLVVGTRDPGGLLIFDLYTAGPPQYWQWPTLVAFTPFDIAARPHGGVWILDRVQRRVWALDRLFNIEPHQAAGVVPTVTDFAPAFTSTTPISSNTTPRPPLTLDAALAVTESDTRAIVSLPDDSFLILAQPSATQFAQVVHYRFVEGRRGAASTDGLLDHLSASDTFVLVGHDVVAFPVQNAPMEPAATLYIASADGNQSFAFDFRLNEAGLPQLTAGAAFLPMRLFEGKGLVAVREQPYYDFGRAWVPLKEQRRPRYPQQATLVTRVLDGREPQCVWHRLMMDAVIPPTCVIRVESRASDDLADFERELEWRAEPTLYRRGNGSEIPFVEAPARNDEGTWELLFQSAHGRFAQIRLTLISDQRSTPRLHAMRVYYPRFSYLNNYLPAAYRDDAASAAFLDRFLAIFEGTYTALEDRIAAVQVLFDERSAPRALLPWLANWLGVILDPSWSEGKRRLFLRNAMTFFQWRGTSRGLKMALRLAMEDCANDALFSVNSAIEEYRFGVRILENFQTRRRGGRWSPATGGEELHRRYRAAVGSDDTSMQYPIVNPGDRNETAWRSFSAQMLGFVPAAIEENRRWQRFMCGRYPDVESLNAKYGSTYTTLDDVPMPQNLPPVGQQLDDWTAFQNDGRRDTRSLIVLWQAFLARRYPTAATMRDAHGTTWRGFDDVAYPIVFPSGALLSDWLAFESTVLAMQRNAHRFQVLLPMFKQDGDDVAREQRRALAQRIVDLEKPAHTVFDVKYYWAMFLVGTARIGHDTQLDLGSRAPQLAAAAVLNQAHLGSGYLTTDFPPPRARRVIGAGPLRQGAATGGFYS